MNKVVKKLIFIFSFIIVIISGVFVYNKTISLSYNKDSKIDKILESESYVYLPNVAKEYIKDIYEETGEVILTEKNKEENIPYLNPNYVSYLELSTTEKSKVEVIPNEQIVDYVYDENNQTTEVPEEYYNLAELGYTTPMYNQGSLGICWAYATVEAAETHLMLTNNKTYVEGETTQFSVRQLDYVSATFGIKDYVNKYGSHTLGWGNNFIFAAEMLSKGLSLYGSNWKYNNLTTTERLELSEVFNNESSLYELDNSIDMPYLNVRSLDLSNESDLNKYNSYISTIKDYIKTYGGPYVAAQAPGYSCSAINVEDSTHYIIDVDNTCTQDGSHAMQIIGWDDNYSYKYCVNGNKHEKWTENCSEENTVTGTGAWILRNSWGDIESYKYTYLTYNSSSVEINFISSLDSSDNREWNYIYDTDSENMLVESNSDKTLILKFENEEEVNSHIDKIKIYNTSSNDEYKIYISDNDEEYELIGTKTVEYPGYFTFEFDDDYYITNETKIKLTRKNTNYFVYTSFNTILTHEDDENMYIKTEDLFYSESDDILDDSCLYNIRLYSDTYNIPSGSVITYKLYDEQNNEITDQMNVSYNVISNNMLNTKLSVPSQGNNAYFTVKLYYNNNLLSTARISSTLPKPSQGTGTEEDPYIIMTPQDLYSINYNLDAHYVLGSDIDLTYDTQNENGLYYNNGNGWISIGYAERKVFNGTLDGYYNGEYHKIIGLKANNNYGLIFWIEGDKDVSIKNIIFEKAIISNSPLLAYTIVGTNESNVTIENIAAMNCNFSGSSSMLANSIYSYDENAVTINNIYNDSTYDTSNGYYLARKVEAKETTSEKSSINISNIQILSYGIYEYLVYNILGSVNISNVLFNNYTNYTPYLFSSLSKSSSEKISNLSNIYYLNSININYDSDSYYTSNNITSKTINELKTSSTYDDWENFSDNWKIESIDGVNRFPVLKFVPFEYTEFNEINVGIEESVSIYDYLTSNKEAMHNLTVTSNNNTVYVDTYGDADNTIIGYYPGTGSIHVESSYDGYEKDIEVNVVDSDKVIIRYNSDNNEITEQVVDKNTNTILDENPFIKTGYKFVSWNTLKDGTGITYNNNQEININDNLTLYAIWEPIQYKVIFHSNNESEESLTQDFTYDIREKLNLNSFEAADSNIKFVNWNTLEDGKGTSYSDGESILNLTSTDNDTINLYAIWDNITYNVEFKSNGGEGSIDTITDIINESITLPDNTFTKTGYKFDSWNTKKDGTGIKYTSKQEITLVKNLILYAIWEPIQYQIKFNSNNENEETSTQNFTYDVSATLNLNSFESTEDRIVFNSWNTKKDGTGTSYTDGQNVVNLASTDNDTINLYAIWKYTSYNIIFDANGAEGTMNMVSGPSNEKITLPQNIFTKTGYYFSHWNTKPDEKGTAYYDKKTFNLTEDLKLYAIWYPNNYTIYWHSEDGAKKNSNSLKYDVEYTATDYKWTLKTGYKFVGWNSKQDGTGDYIYKNDKFKNLTTENEKSLNYYAILEPIKYKIKYDANGGIGEMSNQELTYDLEANLNENTFTKEDYKFTGWNSKQDGTGETYTDKQSVSNLSSTENDVVTLYAIWESTKATITFNSNSGTGTMDKIDTNIGESTTLTKNTYTKEGYIFDHWNTKDDNTGNSYQDKENIEVTESITLYAIWEPIQYNVKWYNENNVLKETTISKYDLEYNIPNYEVDKEGYIFDSWNTKKDGTGNKLSYGNKYKNLTITNNDEINYYAILKPITYQIKFNKNNSSSNGLMSNQILTYDKEESLTKNNFTLTGYKFIGWNTMWDQTGSTYEDEATIKNLTTTENKIIDLYAMWKPNVINIKWYKDDNTLLKENECIYDVSYPMPTYDIKPGYKFKEWNYSHDGTGTSLTGSTYKNITTWDNITMYLYAIIEPIKYQVKFDANGGTGEMSNQNLTYDTESNLNANVFTNGELVFKGWNTKADGTGTTYKNKKAVKNLTAVDNDIITLYAIWKESTTIISNDTKDTEVTYDGNEYTLDIDVDVEDYNIVYSTDNTNYNLTEIPKYKNVGEYTIYYKITKEGYEDYTGSNKVKIYGIKSIDPSVIVVDDIILKVSNNSFDNLKNKFELYSTLNSIIHLDNDRNYVEDDVIKTGDRININITPSKQYQYIIIYSGDVNGDGKISYIDYVQVYNHIQKSKHPESDKNYLEYNNSFAADMNNDDNINYMDYILIYKKIQELKKGS